MSGPNVLVPILLLALTPKISPQGTELFQNLYTCKILTKTTSGNNYLGPSGDLNVGRYRKDFLHFPELRENFEKLFGDDGSTTANATQIWFRYIESQTKLQHSKFSAGPMRSLECLETAKKLFYEMGLGQVDDDSSDHTSLQVFRRFVPNKVRDGKAGTRELEDFHFRNRKVDRERKDWLQRNGQ